MNAPWFYSGWEKQTTQTLPPSCGSEPAPHLQQHDELRSHERKAHVHKTSMQIKRDVVYVTSNLTLTRLWKLTMTEINVVTAAMEKLLLNTSYKNRQPIVN